MAIEYDSDDIGELDEDSDNAIQGAVSVDQYDKLLSKFLDDHPVSNHVHEAGFEYHTAASDGRNHFQDQEAVEKVYLYWHVSVLSDVPLQTTSSCCCGGQIPISNASPG